MLLLCQGTFGKQSGSFPPSAFYDFSNILIMIEIPTLTPYKLYVLAAYLVIYYASSLG